MSIYDSEQAAAARVRQLRALGYWPGMIAAGDGRYRLTFDPDTSGQRGRRAAAAAQTGGQVQLAPGTTNRRSDGTR